MMELLAWPFFSVSKWVKVHTKTDSCMDIVYGVARSFQHGEGGPSPEALFDSFQSCVSFSSCSSVTHHVSSLLISYIPF